MLYLYSISVFTQVKMLMFQTVKSIPTVKHLDLMARMSLLIVDC
jgi:hypothetical protein